MFRRGFTLGLMLVVLPAVIFSEMFAGELKENCALSLPMGCECYFVGQDGFNHTVHYPSIRYCLQPKHKGSLHTMMPGTSMPLNNGNSNFRENCQPVSTGGCSCIETDINEQQFAVRYDNEADCMKSEREKRATATAAREQQLQTRRKSSSVDNLQAKVTTDPIRSRAEANYAKVLDELHMKFSGLKEGCFPRPKGCMCITGKDTNGREITERRMSDKDCKCQPGEKGPQCPVN